MYVKMQLYKGKERCVHLFICYLILHQPLQQISTRALQERERRKKHKAYITELENKLHFQSHTLNSMETQTEQSHTQQTDQQTQATPSPTPTSSTSSQTHTITSTAASQTHTITSTLSTQTHTITSNKSTQTQSRYIMCKCEGVVYHSLPSSLPINTTLSITTLSQSTTYTLHHIKCTGQARKACCAPCSLLKRNIGRISSVDFQTVSEEQMVVSFPFESQLQTLILDMELNQHKTIALKVFITLLRSGLLESNRIHSAIQFAADVVECSFGGVQKWLTTWKQQGGHSISQRGQHPKHWNFLMDEDYQHKAIKWIQQNKSPKGGPNMRTQDFCNYLNNTLLVDELDTPISDDTARLWLHRLGFKYMDAKRGAYVDGHEREDVVKYREEVFLPTMQKLEPFLAAQCASGGYQQGGDITELPVIIFVHDESVFSANDDERTFWGQERDVCLC